MEGSVCCVASSLLLVQAGKHTFCPTPRRLVWCVKRERERGGERQRKKRHKRTPEGNLVGVWCCRPLIETNYGHCCCSRLHLKPNHPVAPTQNCSEQRERGVVTMPSSSAKTAQSSKKKTSSAGKNLRKSQVLSWNRNLAHKHKTTHRKTSGSPLYHETTTRCTYSIVAHGTYAYIP